MDYFALVVTILQICKMRGTRKLSHAFSSWLEHDQVNEYTHCTAMWRYLEPQLAVLRNQCTKPWATFRAWEQDYRTMPGAAMMAGDPYAWPVSTVMRAYGAMNMVLYTNFSSSYSFSFWEVTLALSVAIDGGNNLTIEVLARMVSDHHRLEYKECLNFIQLLACHFERT